MEIQIIDFGSGGRRPSTFRANRKGGQRKGRLGNPANINDSLKATNKRASNACLRCRSRKVSCDVLRHEPGMSCTNCRLDNIPCILTESKRQQKRTGPLKLSRQSRSLSVSPADRSEPQTAQGDEPGPEHYPSDSPMESVNVFETVSENCQEDFPNDFAQRLSTPGVDADDSTSYVDLVTSQISPARNTSDRIDAAKSTSSFQTDYSSASLPTFLQNDLSHMSTQDIEFLERKGVFQVPELKLRNELLKAYVGFVHGYLPVLDLHDFLEIINNTNQISGKLSLLLFHAVLFAGSTFVDLEFLTAAGYKSRREARKAFFQKAKLLYDFDYESNQISLIQALLLMTYWIETLYDHKHAGHWLAISINLAYDIGLHKNPENTRMDKKTQSLWKRIWWSCYMRDSLLGLALHRPTRICKDSYDVPMLSWEDFLVKEPQQLSPEESHHTILSYDIETQNRINVMCIEKIKLCMRISDILSILYTLSHYNQGMKERDNQRLVSLPLVRRSREYVADCEVKTLEYDLKNWFFSLPEDAKYKAPATGQSEGENIQAVHSAVLHMVYSAALLALHMPLDLPINNPMGPRTLAQAVSYLIIRDAAQSITTIAKDLNTFQLARFLPPIGVSVVLPAVMFDLLSIKNTDGASRQREIDRVVQCMQTMQSLQDNYPMADVAAGMMIMAVHRNALSVYLAHSKEWRQFTEVGDAGVSVSDRSSVTSLTPLPPTPVILAIASPEQPSSSSQETPVRLHSVIYLSPQPTPRNPFRHLDYFSTCDSATLDTFNCVAERLLNFDEGRREDDLSAAMINLDWFNFASLEGMA